jgi:very-long-chain enoyl-CoA reductase
MMIWAKDKHRRYKIEFGDKYPKNRTAMIPFIF